MTVGPRSTAAPLVYASSPSRKKIYEAAYHRSPMSAELPVLGTDSAIGFGSGISDDHRDGIRWVDYANISWNPVFCKRCDICVEICP